MAIYKKLLDFQKLGITVERNALNPHFKSKYSSLNEVLDKVKGPLNEMGVVIVQQAELDSVGLMATSAGSYGLRTSLIDTEDETKLSCFVPFVGATDMQKLGGAITYARRYSLVTLLGLEDEDDDGNVASAPKAPAKPVKKPETMSDGKPVPFSEESQNIDDFFNSTPDINA